MYMDNNTVMAIFARPAVSEEILRIVAEIDEFKGAWRALGTLAPERLTALRQVATIESIGSSTRIEGAKLSDRQVEKLLSNLQIQSFTTRDEQEVAGYAFVMEMIFADWKAIDLTENHIKQFHRDLLKYSGKDERHRGAYKMLPNHIEAFGPDGKSLGVVFQTATPFDTPRLMTELIDWTNRVINERRHHPLLTIAIFIVTFLAIHPFQDGNGRLSRNLTTLLLLRADYIYVPYSSLESIIERSKESYYLSLRRTQGTIWTDKQDWEPWSVYFLRALQQQKGNLDDKVSKEKLMQARLPRLSAAILEAVKRHGRLTLADAVSITTANRNTVKKHVQSLVASGHLIKQGRGKGTWYILA
jgi:Fic family protein